MRLTTCGAKHLIVQSFKAFEGGQTVGISTKKLPTKLEYKLSAGASEKYSVYVLAVYDRYLNLHKDEDKFSKVRRIV